jgi:hypothetical protein
MPVHIDHQAAVTEWQRLHERDLSRFRSLLRLVGYDVRLNYDGVVPSLTFEDPAADPERHAQVYLVSPRGYNELTGYHFWNVGAMEVPDFAAINEHNFDPYAYVDEEWLRLQIVNKFDEYVRTYIKREVAS